VTVLKTVFGSSTVCVVEGEELGGANGLKLIYVDKTTADEIIAKDVERMIKRLDCVDNPKVDLDLCREDRDARVVEERNVEPGERGENEEEDKPTVVSEDLEEENAAEVVGGEENVDERTDKEVVRLLTVELVLEAAPIVPEGLLLNAT